MNIVSYESNQQVFEIVAKHLFAQGRQSKDTNGCLYRGPNETSCAIGCLIPDEIYVEEMDKPNKDIIWSGINYILPAHSSLQELFKNIDHDLLSELQGIHDRTLAWDSTHDMTTELSYVGGRYNLDTEFLNNLSFKDR